VSLWLNSSDNRALVARAVEMIREELAAQGASLGDQRSPG
jgi:hypothetical protein